tara:strand:- start:151 stop:531 length:381 start_codon:yes stop_codon:yes gene_type:complete
MKIGSLFNIFRWRDRRGERVESTEANVFIDDVSHPVMDLSESGFRIENHPDSPAVGERFAFRFELPLTSEDVFEFEAWAEVVDNSNRGLAVRYLHLEAEIADRIHEVLRVLSIMNPSVPKRAITYD